MLRETSEIAASISVNSTPSNPSSAASARPFWRAVTISLAEVIGTWPSLDILRVPVDVSVQIGQTFLEVERCSDPFQRQTQLHHRKCDLRLDAHDNCFRPAQFEHVRDGAQSASGERIDDVEHGHIDDHA